MNKFFNRLFFKDIEPEIEPDPYPPGKIFSLTATEIAEIESFQRQITEQERMAMLPLKIKCQECGKEIGVRSPGKEIEWTDHDVSHNVYCPDCWNLKKLKE